MAAEAAVLTAAVPPDRRTVGEADTKMLSRTGRPTPDAAETACRQKPDQPAPATCS